MGIPIIDVGEIKMILNRWFMPLFGYCDLEFIWDL